ncbi:DUF4238 domain-containing protein [uncultured Rhodoferax sp.]|uniref:DUF4238 domain-containing protein n=1 Tax=uncultured Rhodoferax sp. TaxID=223188 RepID=UPI0025F10477|nr:DUF4238 domain-containing protein [uncultured Rhodoferax sp.]
MAKPHLSGAKEQHYVPRFYLAGFAENNSLSCLDRRSGKLASRTPEHTARIPNLYTFQDNQDRRRYDIEAMFGHYENIAGHIILKLAARQSIDLNEREQMTAFIAFAALRTPAAIEEAKVVHAGFTRARAQTELSDEERALSWLRKMHGPDADETSLREEAASVSEMVRDGSYTLEVDNEFAVGKSLRNFEAVATSIFARDWMVLYAPEASEGFLTTDHPVVLTTRSSALRREPLGYGSPHAQVLFPLAHNCALVISGDLGRFGRTDIKLEDLSRFNRTMATYCHRYLFGRSGSHLQSIADSIQLTQKRWKSNYSVGMRQGDGRRYTDVFVMRNGEPPHEQGLNQPINRNKLCPNEQQDASIAAVTGPTTGSM